MFLNVVAFVLACFLCYPIKKKHADAFLLTTAKSPCTGLIQYKDKSPVCFFQCILKKALKRSQCEQALRGFIHILLCQGHYGKFKNMEHVGKASAGSFHKNKKTFKFVLKFVCARKRTHLTLMKM